MYIFARIYGIVTRDTASSRNGNLKQTEDITHILGIIYILTLE